MVPFSSQISGPQLSPVLQCPTARSRAAGRRGASHLRGAKKRGLSREMHGWSMWMTIGIREYCVYIYMCVHWHIYIRLYSTWICFYVTKYHWYRVHRRVHRFPSFPLGWANPRWQWTMAVQEPTFFRCPTTNQTKIYLEIKKLSKIKHNV